MQDGQPGAPGNALPVSPGTDLAATGANPGMPPSATSAAGATAGPGAWRDQPEVATALLREFILRA